ncbi:MAG TPA: dihydroorotase [Maribacter sp.]|uniref:dihydroorotase n=1 Tax=unclassified Maribacter TaxID=2615042 RepID=UPI000ED2B572|nr:MULTISPECIES: dihydroorotase [unclassified Maribacter]HAF76606.1 dihydroorotase [Maribacter sp.]HAI40706.1 dihydroorotase [Maribacter sp.]|tara:strand:- start:12005 stop:13342 length:1338 start_codon:yes stop_codon:yes gene_type:complete
MGKIVLKNGTIVNEGIVQEKDILIVDDVISKIADDISDAAAEVIDVAGMHILPGVIDDQVHFREPGLTHKGTIATESRAALAGGITTFMEQPNTTPQTTTIEKLEEKFATASNSAFANYSFLFGGTNDNLEELKRLDKNACSGIKLFLGSSTGNMLVDDEKVIENIFSNTEMVISAHCEDETTIRENLAKYKAEYGDDIPVEMHPIIRSEEACYLSSSRAIALAKKTGARLHVFHLSTGKETDLFRNDIPLGQKKITAEVCIHHLWFSDADYANKGTLIKWNPAVKTAKDRVMLWNALLDDRIDVIATDHAPHLLEEKNNVYTKAPSGGPLVQHALNAMLEKVKDGTITLEKMVQKMCHNPAILFQIEKRGYIREGYYADLVVANLNSPWTVSKENIAYKCKWSPFEDTTFSSKVVHTFINGHLGYSNGVFSEKRNAKRLTFNRS